MNTMEINILQNLTTPLYTMMGEWDHLKDKDIKDITEEFNLHVVVYGFLTHLLEMEKTESTINTYQAVLTRFCHFIFASYKGSVYFNDIKMHDVETFFFFLKSIDHDIPSIVRHRTIIHSFHEFLTKEYGVTWR